MKSIVASVLSLFCAAAAFACDFADNFAEETIRIDMSVFGIGPAQGIYIDRLGVLPGWWGRRVNLSKIEYPAALTYAVVDKATGDTIYADSKYFSHSMDLPPEAPEHSVALVPKPLRDATFTVTAWSYGRRGWIKSFTTEYPLSERAMAKMPRRHRHAPYKMIRQAKSPDRAITLAVLAEGYKADEMDKFLSKAAALDSALFSHDAFAARADRFNVVAVMTESAESGISRPSKGELAHSALGAHFDSYNMDRLITLPDIWRVWDAIGDAPASHVLILANTEMYGGSGPYHEYAVASADNAWWRQIITHEFAHSFASLADEYEEGFADYYFPDVEPDDPNITTLCDFSGKWQPLIDSGEASLIEGAGYQSKGVWRGCPTCLMRALPDRRFCAVCNRAIIATIDFLTEERQ